VCVVVVVVVVVIVVVVVAVAAVVVVVTINGQVGIFLHKVKCKWEHHTRLSGHEKAAL
jgi:hypothetical protein